jgi:hypothetical protein
MNFLEFSEAHLERLYREFVMTIRMRKANKRAMVVNKSWLINWWLVQEITYYIADNCMKIE